MEKNYCTAPGGSSECEFLSPGLECGFYCQYNSLTDYINAEDFEEDCSNCYFTYLEHADIETCNKCSDKSVYENISCSQWKPVLNNNILYLEILKRNS